MYRECPEKIPLSKDSLVWKSLLDERGLMKISRLVHSDRIEKESQITIFSYNAGIQNRISERETRNTWNLQMSYSSRISRRVLHQSDKDNRNWLLTCLLVNLNLYRNIRMLRSEFSAKMNFGCIRCCNSSVRWEDNGIGNIFLV